MSGTAKGRFPARPLRKLKRDKAKNFNHRVLRDRLKDELRTDWNSFRKIFGESEEDEEFYGFSSEDLNAHNRQSSGTQSSSEISDNSFSPTVFAKRMSAPRSSHTRDSFDVLPSLRQNSPAKIFMKNSSSEVSSRSSDNAASAYLVKLESLESNSTSKNFDTSVQCPHESAQSGSGPGDGPGHPNSPGDLLPARAVTKPDGMEQPAHPATAIAPHSSTKVGSFVLPARSSRSSRIIKANPKYIDQDDCVQEESDDAASPHSAVKRPSFPRKIVDHTDVSGSVEKNLKNNFNNGQRDIHIDRFCRWKRMISKDPPNPKSIYLGLDKRAFHSLCIPTTSASKGGAWSVREIHNILHGVHIFGISQWLTIRKYYVFQATHTSRDVRRRYEAAGHKNLVSSVKVKSDILPLLQPKLTTEGAKYLQIGTLKVQERKPVQQVKIRTSENKCARTTTRKRRMLDRDRARLSQKQPHRNAKDTQPCDNSSEVQDESVGDCILPTSDGPEYRPPGEKLKKIRGGSMESRRKRNARESLKIARTKVPQMKKVLRRSSSARRRNIVARGNRRRTAPNQGRKKVATPAEKVVRSDSDSSTDTANEDGGNVPQMEPATRRKKDNLKILKGKGEWQNRGRCNTCTSCSQPKCGACKLCRRKSSINACVRRPQCLCPTNSNASSPKEIGKKLSSRQKRDSALAHAEPKRSNSPPRSLPDRAVAAGIMLSPDSRRRLQQELYERDQRLPSIVQIDEWKERYELQDLWKMGGVSIITSTTPSTRFICFLCGSAGKERPMRRRLSANSTSSMDASETFARTPLFVFCCSCCEPFHPFCLDDHEQQLAVTDAKKGVWICKRCRVCNVCGRPGDLLECKRCTKTFHTSCLGANYPTKPSKNRVWVCMRCVRCRSCGASRPGRRAGSKWTHDFQLCQRCGDLFNKGNFCPICRRCYRDEDYETRMVQCGTCNRWVHSRCESMTIEMYTLLSHLPDDVQYVCPDCDGRRAELELLGHGERTLAEDCGNDSIEGDRMTELLSRLPPPSWKSVLENELQSGIETVTMALFHNKEAACVMKRSATVKETSHPIDLFAIRYAVHNRRYTSVAEFSSDVCSILDTISNEEISNIVEKKVSVGGRPIKKEMPKTGAKGAFCHEMRTVFPWFDVGTGRVMDCSDVPEDLLPHATLPPYDDHIYAQWQDKDIDVSAVGLDTPVKNFPNGSPSKADNIGTIAWSSSPQKEYDDMRQCLFCSKYGDDSPTNAGRLLYCGQDEWVHVNCALWSAEVFERHDGSLQNVYSAVSRGRMMRCKLCTLPGATVGCNSRDCPKNYHFTCAKIAQCSFLDDKKVFCSRHEKNIEGELVTEEGFEVGRRVVVDNDEMRPNKRWQKGVLSRDITVLLGSAIVHQLGYISPSSDDRDFLIPVHFRMTRMFWSTTHANHRVRYTVTVTEQKTALECPELVKNLRSSNDGKVERHENLTISHASDGEGVTPLSKSLRQPGAVACKSKLVDRMRLLASGPMTHRKPHNTAAQTPCSTFSGSSLYTVIGSCNKTLPQTITPLPTISRSSNSLQHLPVVSRSRNDGANPQTGTLLASVPTALSDGTDTPLKLLQVARSEKLSADDAVVVSPQNPFLNLEIGNPSAGTDVLSASCLSPVLKNPPCEVLSASTKCDLSRSVFGDLFGDLQSDQGKNLAESARAVRPAGVSYGVGHFKSGSSGLLARKVLPANNLSTSKGQLLNSRPSAPQTSNVATVLGQPMCERVFTTIASTKSITAASMESLPSSVAPATRQCVTEASSATSVGTPDTKISEHSESVNLQTNSLLNSLLSKVISPIKNGMTSVAPDDLFAKTLEENVSKPRTLTRSPELRSLESSNTRLTQSPKWKGLESLNACMTHSPELDGLKSLHARLTRPPELEKLEGSDTDTNVAVSIQKYAVMRGASPERNSTAISLLQQARNACEIESSVESQKFEDPVKSATLWWKRTESVKKNARDTKHRRRTFKTVERMAKGAVTRMKDDFIVSDESEEETGARRMPTRSGSRSVVAWPTCDDEKATTQGTVSKKCDFWKSGNFDPACANDDKICEEYGQLKHDLSSLDKSSSLVSSSSAGSLYGSTSEEVAGSAAKESAVVKVRQFAKKSRNKISKKVQRKAKKRTKRKEPVTSPQSLQHSSYDSANVTSTPLAKRFRSKSTELKRIRKDLCDLEVETVNGRYPRRNPRTRLKSFSGLSPSYAIRSYLLSEKSGSEQLCEKRKVIKFSEKEVVLNSCEDYNKCSSDGVKILSDLKPKGNTETEHGMRFFDTTLETLPTMLKDSPLDVGDGVSTSNTIDVTPKSVSYKSCHGDSGQTIAVHIRNKNLKTEIQNNNVAVAENIPFTSPCLEMRHGDVINADKNISITVPDLRDKTVDRTLADGSEFKSKTSESSNEMELSTTTCTSSGKVDPAAARMPGMSCKISNTTNVILHSEKTSSLRVDQESEEFSSGKSSAAASQQVEGESLEPLSSTSRRAKITQKVESSLKETVQGNPLRKIVSDLRNASPPPIEAQRGLVGDKKGSEEQINIQPDIVFKAGESGQTLAKLINAAPRSPLAISDLATFKPLPPSTGMKSIPSRSNTKESILDARNCPVLSTDEVQSLLAVPSTAALSPFSVTVSSHIPAPTLCRARNCNTEPSITPTIKKNVNQYHNNLSSNTFTYKAPRAQNLARRLTYTVAMPRNHLPGASFSHVQPQYRMVIPAVNPAAVQRPIYTQVPIVTCVSKSEPTARLAHSATGSGQCLPSLIQTAARSSGGAAPLPVASPLSAVSSLANMKSPVPGMEDDVHLTQEQVKKLEKMIEFYCNKNRLSVGEKQLVGQIIAQQIKNKKLPLPTLDDEQPTAASEEQGKGHTLLAGQKRKQPSDKPLPLSAAKPAKRRRKEQHVQKCDDPDIPDLADREQFCQLSNNTIRSPLLNVYLNATHAKRRTGEKLAKKWRKDIRSLSQLNVFLSGPSYSGKGQREKQNRLPPPPQSAKQSHLLYEIRSDDGYHAKGTDLQELVSNLLHAVQDCRVNSGQLQANSLCLSNVLLPHAFLGVSHDAIRFLVEQLPSARHCIRYKAKYHKHKESPVEVVTHINPHGCARAEKYQGRSKPDMFSFLASKHRLPPAHDPSQTQNIDMQQTSTRRPTSMELPMAMRFRHLKTSAREAVGVYRSAIHGRGLFCKRDIEVGEMVMEYTGEVIRSFMTDSREKMYENKGIGCYMFRMDDMFVIDATVMGSGARFINHSCEPSCYSRIVTIEGKKRIIIFALRKILRGEELTYDYKFPIEAEDQKIMCNCGAKTCRKFMN